jgi:alkaline phosphatase
MYQLFDTATGQLAQNPYHCSKKPMKFKHTLSLAAILLLFSVTVTAQMLPTRVRNVILMIGDGMGVSHITGAMTVHKAPLFLQQFPVSGLATTQSADNYITDSAAAGTALACGVKTYNGAIGLDALKKPVPSLVSIAESVGKHTGIVVTSAITHATPASFVAHQEKRDMYEEIALDILASDIEVMIGGGWKHFTSRKDKRDLLVDLRSKGYQVAYSLAEVQIARSPKLAGLLAEEHMPPVAERKDMLPRSVDAALRLLAPSPRGFFMMIEGSQIDFEGHTNESPDIFHEMIDFDDAIGVVLAFAKANPGTLVVVTADHETGGLALKSGNSSTGQISALFASTNHTGTMVPVFAYGPGSEQFSGIMDNTHIQHKLARMLRDGR